MVKETVAFGLGLTAGVIAVGIGVGVYYYVKHMDDDNEDNVINDSFVDVADNKKDSFRELYDNRLTVHLLTPGVLTQWFKDKKDKLDGTLKMVVAYPDEKTLMALGYHATEELNKRQNILQFFYDDEKKEAKAIRLVNFDIIDSNIEAKLIDNEGLIVIKD